MVRARIDVVDAGMPLDFSDTRFDVMIKSLAASLEGCEGQVLEFFQLQSRGFQEFKLQCNFLVNTLSPAANERLLRYNKTLELVRVLRRDMCHLDPVFCFTPNPDALHLGCTLRVQYIMHCLIPLLCYCLAEGTFW